MANRRIEMHEYQKALYRMRQGQTDRAISRDRVLGRRKVGELRQLAAEQGWLSEGSSMPTAAQIAALSAGRVKSKSGASTRFRGSSVSPFAKLIERYFESGVQGVATPLTRAQAAFEGERRDPV